MDEVPEIDLAEVAELKRAVAVLAREVEALTDRTARLVLALEGSAPARPRTTAPPAEAPASPDPVGEPDPFRVVVTPVSELALAAVAETTLRGLPEVRRVVEIVRSDHEARFELELEPGTDLVGSLRGALPVPFESDSSADDELVITLRPAWGPAQTA